jgi:hypothetical protein
MPLIPSVPKSRPIFSSFSCWATPQASLVLPSFLVEYVSPWHDSLNIYIIKADICNSKKLLLAKQQPCKKAVLAYRPPCGFCFEISKISLTSKLRYRTPVSTKEGSSLKAMETIPSRK